jgi:taurine dioxygenase
MRAELLTRNIGAEVTGVNLGDASRDDGLFNEIKALQLRVRMNPNRKEELI